MKNTTSARVGEILNVHPVTVRRWKIRGHIPIETLEYLEYRLSHGV